eukprot:g24001.t1
MPIEIIRKILRGITQDTNPDAVLIQAPNKVADPAWHSMSAPKPETRNMRPGQLTPLHRKTRSAGLSPQKVQARRAQSEGKNRRILHDENRRILHDAGESEPDLFVHTHPAGTPKSNTVPTLNKVGRKRASARMSLGEGVDRLLRGQHRRQVSVATTPTKQNGRSLVNLNPSLNRDGGFKKQDGEGVKASSTFNTLPSLRENGYTHRKSRSVGVPASVMRKNQDKGKNLNPSEYLNFSLTYPNREVDLSTEPTDHEFANNSLTLPTASSEAHWDASTSSGGASNRSFIPVGEIQSGRSALGDPSNRSLAPLAEHAGRSASNDPSGRSTPILTEQSISGRSALHQHSEIVQHGELNQSGRSGRDDNNESNLSHSVSSNKHSQLDVA